MEKIKLDHPDSQSADLVAQHIEQLSQLFPEVIKEGKVDFEALQDLLGNYIDTPEERFQLNWAGKSQARREAQKRSTGTLRPCPEESINWDTTENLYIEGDNLEVLKLLQKSYYKKVKMIYIDPPYNTGKDFVYKDNYNDNLTNYLEISGQDRTLGTNTESDGRYHSNWLNMMYPRLKLARNLLTDDGAIFISIDDNEISNLKKICDEIFGEENFICKFIWAAGRKNDSKYVSISHEYIVCYVKDSSFLKESEIIWRERKQGLDDIYAEYNYLKKTYNDDVHKIEKELKSWYKNLPTGHPAEDHSHYCKVDQKGIFFASDISWPGGGGPMYEILHPITKKAVKTPSRGWLTNKENMKNWIEEDRVYFGEDENSVPCLKSYLTEREYSVPYSVFYKDGRASTKRLMSLMGCKVFENPKDEEIISRIIEFVGTNNSIILDFFSGSGTTAHSVFLSNCKDNGNRRFICVQLPEIIDPQNSPSDKTKKVAENALELLESLSCPYTIAEIGKERIRRAGKKIVEELKAKQEKEGALFAEEPKRLDIGFKVFKLDSSNINTWDSSPSNLEGALYNSVQNIKSDRTEHDLLYEILLKYGIDLVQPINEHVLSGKKVYEMGAGALIVCMADHIKPEVAEAIAQLWKKVKPTAIDESSKTAINCRVVFKDNGFDDNNDKTNVLQILKQHGIDHVVTI